MAEALAFVGLTSSILEFVTFGAKTIERLQDFQRRVGDVPKAFKDIKLKLSLLSEALKRTEEQFQAGHGGQDLQTTLLPVVEDCHAQVELLNEILAKTLPHDGDNSLRRVGKALRSLRQEKKVTQITKTLSDHVQLLTYYHTTGLPQQGSSRPKASLMIPFIRDVKFIDREDIIKEIRHRLSVQRRVALAGIGGVG